MQQLTDFDFSKFKNSSGWQVIHDDDDQLFYIANNNGNRLAGKYTTKRFAEKRMYDYLESLQNNIKVPEPTIEPEPQVYDLFGKLEVTPLEDDSSPSVEEPVDAPPKPTNKFGLKAVEEV